MKSKASIPAPKGSEEIPVVVVQADGAAGDQQVKQILADLNVQETAEICPHADDTYYHLFNWSLEPPHKGSQRETDG